MNYIFFDEIYIKNFFSIGNQGITFKYEKGLNIISGRNYDTGGYNGCGKSVVICDAILFALFNKTLRKVNKEQIINMTNKKDTLIKLKFRIGNDSYEIERGINPTYCKFYKNGTYKNDIDVKETQKNIETLLGAGFEVYKNIMVMNLNYSQPFLDLQLSDRKKVFDNILNMLPFQKMDKNANDEIKKLDKQRISLSSKISSDESNIRNLESKLKALLKSKEEEIKKLQDEADIIKKKIDGFDIELKELNDDNKEILAEDYTEKLDKIKTKIAEGSQQAKNYEKNIKLLTENSKCPICNTSITDVNVSDYKKEMEDRVKDIKDKLDKLYKIEEKTRKNSNLKNKIKDDIMMCGYNRQREETKLKMLLSDIERKTKNEQKDVITQEEIDELNTKLNGDKVGLKKVESDIIYYEYIRKILSDEGVKKYILQKLVDVFNNRINFYISKLNGNFTVKFNWQLEESIKSYNRNILKYHNYSGGERVRINLAIILALYDLLQAQNKLLVNILVMDELLDCSIDADGITDFMGLLFSKFIYPENGNPNMCIYVITHKNYIDNSMKATNRIYISKRNGFSFIDSNIEKGE